MGCVIVGKGYAVCDSGERVWGVQVCYSGERYGVCQYAIV